MGDKTFADLELAGEMGSFKEPGVRLKQVEGEGALSFADGDVEKALFLGMQASANLPYSKCLNFSKTVGNCMIQVLNKPLFLVQSTCHNQCKLPISFGQ